MYTACLFCNKSLGSNESFETFPVGKRLAFDTAKGRLWVVCPHCERWNLSPLEERWETIERAEQFYRDTRTRVATENIGLAKLRDGTTIVRIGQPLRPEFAAWRYGDQFGRRRRNQLLIAGGGVLLLGGVLIGGTVAAGGIGGMGWLIGRGFTNLISGSPEAVVAKIQTEKHGVVHVRRRHLGETVLERSENGEMAIELRFKNGKARFEGREAVRVASIIVPKVNRYGGSKETIGDAVREIESGGGSEGYLDKLTTLSGGYTRSTFTPDFNQRRGVFGRRQNRRAMSEGLFALPRQHRLALEMALHEEVERRALQGELAELELAWKNAEEIAGISDSLLVAPSVEEEWKRLKSEKTE
ncbi:MAG TPA: hypothetical protein VGM50_16910 [Gemmatimonadaceae bacterium]